MLRDDEVKFTLHHDLLHLNHGCSVAVWEAVRFGARVAAERLQVGVAIQGEGSYPWRTSIGRLGGRSGWVGWEWLLMVKQSEKSQRLNLLNGFLGLCNYVHFNIMVKIFYFNLFEPDKPKKKHYLKCQIQKKTSEWWQIKRTCNIGIWKTDRALPWKHYQ